MLDETVNKFSNNVSTHKLTNTSLAEKKDVCFFIPSPCLYSLDIMRVSMS